MRPGVVAWVAMLCGAALLPGCRTVEAPPRVPVASWEARYEPVAFERLPTVADADLLAALPAWRASCRVFLASRDPRRVAWQAACRTLPAANPGDAPAPDPAPLLAAWRAWLARETDAWQVLAVPKPDGAAPRTDRGLLTAYYEPELEGRRTPDARFRVPLHRRPDDLLIVDFGDRLPEARGQRLRGRIVEGAAGGPRRVVPYPARADLLAGDALRGLEVAWVEDPLDAFLLQVQGSGRVRFDDGVVLRLAYDEVNGQPYRAIGGWLVAQGELTREQATVPGIAAWARAHPARVDELLAQNPSYVFFRPQPVGDPTLGPHGAMGVPLTAGYSVAVDPRWLALGAPLVIGARHSATGTPLSRLVVAQDTGGAIKGPLRLDLFEGTGAEAGARAGVQREPVVVWLLTPRGVPPEALLPVR
jgi:membrane-bound lytic murein transglycosylase A